MTDKRTISQLETEGYRWIGCECCKGTVWVPFKMSAALHGEDETALTMRPTRMTIWPIAWLAWSPLWLRAGTDMIQ